MTRLVLRLVLLSAALFCASSACAQDTHVILVTGVSGDSDLAAQYHTWALAVMDAAAKAGVADANLAYLAEDPAVDPAHIRARSTRENVSKAFADAAAKARPDDEVFVLLIGHGSFDGRQAAFNLPGPDLTAGDFADLLKKMATQRVVFVNTASSSGAFLEALKGPGRTIVTSTKTGGERLDPRFPEFFVKALTTTEADQDRNGRVSVLEAFNYATRQVQDAFEKGGHIITEHAAIDDGSDGKLAATLFLAPQGAKRADIAAVTDPALRALLEQQDALERQVAALRLKKDVIPPAEYDAQLEKLVTDLALKTREVRELEGKKK